MAVAVLTIFIILYSLIAIESLLLIFLLWRTPAIPFMIAFLMKRPLIYMIGKDRLGEFKTLVPKFGGGSVKNIGLFSLTENSHTLEMKTKTPIYFAFRDHAATLDITYPAILQEIKEKGIRITNIEDITNLITNIKDKLIDTIDIGIKPFKTYKLHELENMFPFNLDPTFIDAQVQGELNKMSKLTKAIPIITGSIIVLIMVAAIAVYIMEKAFKGCISVGDASAMVSAAKCSSGAVINTIINNTPIA
jgi:hypothetical protein